MALRDVTPSEPINVSDINPAGKANLDDYLASLGVEPYTGGVQMWNIGNEDARSEGYTYILRTAAGVYVGEVTETEDGSEEYRLVSINGTSTDVLVEFNRTLREVTDNG